MIIGTCLSVAEVRQLAGKAGVSIAGKNDFAIHQLTVECAADKQHPLTQRVQKQLDRTYALQIKNFRLAKTSQGLGELWSAGWKSGQVASSLWALVTHPSATREVILEAYGKVHMMSHLSGASTCVDRERLLEQDNLIESLSNELKRVKTRHSETTQSLIELKIKFQNEQAKYLKVKSESLHAEKKPQESKRLINTKLVVATELIAQLRHKIGELQQCVRNEKNTNKRQSLELERLKRLLTVSRSEDLQQDDASLKLCGQCVLYLGGKAQQRRHFQALVESCEGRFLHHDGGRESCPHRISELVRQADVVMCPTDCISHGAMEKARDLCAKQDKPIVFMQRASLSSFTRDLQKVFSA